MRTTSCLLTALTILLPGIAQLQSSAEDSHSKRPLSMRKEMMKRTSSAQYADIHGFHGNGPAVGTMAPDFILEPLEDYDFGLPTQELGNSESDPASIRLSDFSGHKPVILIFGSYT